VIDRKSIALFIFCHYHLYNKCHHFTNFVKIPYIITDSVRMMYKHLNVWECFKKQILLMHILHLFDNYNKILQNAWYIHQDNVVFLVSK